MLYFWSVHLFTVLPATRYTSTSVPGYMLERQHVFLPGSQKLVICQSPAADQVCAGASTPFSTRSKSSCMSVVCVPTARVPGVAVLFSQCTQRKPALYSGPRATRTGRCPTPLYLSAAVGAKRANFLALQARSQQTVQLDQQCVSADNCKFISPHCCERAHVGIEIRT